jgi:hypothetical protein
MSGLPSLLDVALVIGNQMVAEIERRAIARLCHLSERAQKWHCAATDGTGVPSPAQ